MTEVASVEAFVKAAGEMRTLEKISFWDCALPASAAGAIGGWLGTCPQLKDVNLGGNKEFMTEAASVQAFVEAAGEMRTLEKISFERCSLPASAADAIGGWLGTCPQLKGANLAN